jgi:hypothetical protein
MRRAHGVLLPFLFALLGALPGLTGPGVARAQVSPGPLAAPHASLEGTSQCLQCHATRGAKAGMDEKCLACHKEVAWMRTAKRGLHASVAAKDCASCHPDHGGRDFALVAWEEGAAEKFDHRRAGFALEGKHARLECAKCHTPALQKSPAAALVKKKDRAKSWLGLQTACADCHADPHRGQLGRACASCHSQEAWAPAGGLDHAKTKFPLTGAHAKVECLKCHAAPQVVKGTDAKGRPLPEWKPLPHADCASCHKDPHAGRFKAACAKCHTTADWKAINRTGFDHDATRYPLRGRHALVACEKCHDPKVPASQKPKFAQCLDCHRDAHAGTATLAGRPADCAACHTVNGWRPSAYTVAAHAASAWPLEGAHVRAACDGCHVRRPDSPANRAALGPARVVLRPAKAACTDCHGDPHAGRFRPGGPRPKANDCRACHGPEAWRPSRYDAAQHASAAYRLEGAHVAVPCVACHAELKARPASSTRVADAAAMRPLRFEERARACAECHRDPHEGQFAKRKDRGACEACHDQAAFAPASRFDHDRDSAYRLEGAHRRVACKGCHESKRGAEGRPYVVYRPTPTRCEACHLAGLRDSLAVPKRSSMLFPSHPPGRGAFAFLHQEATHANVR